jgi:hypothetical protein
VDKQLRQKLLTRHKRSSKKQLGAYYSTYALKLTPSTDARLHQISMALGLDRSEVLRRLIDSTHAINKETLNEIFELQKRIQLSETIENIMKD